MPDLYSTMSNFLAQLYTAEGRFEEAERVILETLDILKAEDGAVAHRGYNLSLLGKLYLEWERLDQASVTLVRAFETTRDVVNEALLPLIRNYYCELLSRPQNPHRDYTLAEELLRATISDVSRSGFLRSDVAAHMLLAQLLSCANRSDEALDHSRTAATTLEEHGTLPALRSEEVLFTHASILQENGRGPEAQDFYDRAAAVVATKAASISDESRRYQYLNRVPLNRWVRHSSPRVSPS